MDNRQDELEILDTAGQDEFVQFRHQWMRHKDAYIFVFSLTNRQSLRELDAYVWSGGGGWGGGGWPPPTAADGCHGP